MLISQKQHSANLENAKKSTGPQTIEGLQASKFNALKYGIAARTALLPHEDPAEFDAVWDAFHAEWQPIGPSEEHYFDQMIVAHWLLARLGRGENRIYCEEGLHLAEQLRLLGQVARQRVTLERSFNVALQTLARLQTARKSAAATVEPPVRAAAQPSAPSVTQPRRHPGPHLLPAIPPSQPPQINELGFVLQSSETEPPPLGSAS